MPKELIQDTSGDFDVKVGWRAGAGLQVGVETADGRSLVTKLYGDVDAQRTIAARIAEAVAARPATVGDHEFGRQVLDIVESSATDPTGSFSGVYSTLDRHGVNRLIRALRQARDSVFGSDA